MEMVKELEEREDSESYTTEKKEKHCQKLDILYVCVHHSGGRTRESRRQVQDLHERRSAQQAGSGIPCLWKK